MTSQNNRKYPQTNKHCQIFVYNTNDISLETLLNPDFRPMEEQSQSALPIQLHPILNNPCIIHL
jgi:hypothetical protein